MITDARALRPDHVPQDLHHREGEIDAISTALEPALRGERAENVCIAGPSGAGKTTLARYVLEQLASEAIDVATPYANCMTTTSTAGTLHQLLRDANRGADLRRQGTPTEVYLDRLRDLADRGPVVVALDEVDVLDDATLLTALYELPRTSMALITVDDDAFFAEVDQRVRSRLGGAVRVHLDAYGHDELVDILSARADVGLEAGRVDAAALDRIADLAAGDARLAIAVLRRAAREARSAGRDAIDAALVETVRDRAQADVHERQVATLSTHQRLLYDVIVEAGDDGISAARLHEIYEQRAQSPKSKRTRRTYLTGLERYGLITATGEGRGTQYFPDAPPPTAD